MKLIKFCDEKKYVGDFLSLGRKLYGKDLVRDEGEIRQILSCTHPLSHSFKSHNFLAYDADEPIGRFVVTFYENDPCAYIGFYECVDDPIAAKFIFDNAARFAKENGAEALVGPVDCSFWINYRLKINMFDKGTYTGEPYNLEYYEKQFLDNGFVIAEHYTSNIYDNVGREYVNEKFEERFKLFSSKGIEIKNLDIEEFDRNLNDVYYLLTDLYKDFPVFKSISRNDFMKLFSSYRKILFPDMVKFAFFQGKMVGFFISAPDYGCLTNNVNLPKILKILKIRKNPRRFVMLYMGVAPEFQGLGKALAFSVMQELKNRSASGIGALTRDGKVTQNYAADLIGDRYEYALLRREL